MDVDTIVAQATPLGVGAVAIVRLSGPDAFGILDRITDEGRGEARRATLTRIVDPDDATLVDRALVTCFDGPASYTGEDVVEISCHGGWLTPRLVVDACVRGGAREAEPGEFTRRAYLRGKLDLVQAEAIGDLIEARSRALRRAAMDQMDRGLSRRVSRLRERLVEVEALLAHHVDFPEEDDAPVPLERVEEEAGALIGQMESMLATAPEGELLREGALTVFAGRPNVGKSSLYNALLGQERAIVTPVAGTTRDALEATVELRGFPFRLVATAGLRASMEEIERLGIEVAHRYAERADRLLFCLEAGREMTEEESDFLEGFEAPVVLVETKSDLVETGGRVTEARGGCVGRMRVSVETGEGLERLRDLLPELVYSGMVSADGDQPVLTRRRHARALRAARDEIEAFRSGVVGGLPAEVAATHLRSAETALEEMLGTVSVDDVLDVVFREFCIGK